MTLAVGEGKEDNSNKRTKNREKLVENERVLGQCAA